MALLTDVNSSTPTLTDLPTELILKILEEPGFRHTTFAQVSRRLNSIITLLFLSSQGFPLTPIENPLPSLQINMQWGEDQYRFLRPGIYRGNMPILAVAFDITAIAHLSCAFIGWSGSRPKRESTRLVRFIKRLKHVDQIVLRLDKDYLYHSRRDPSESEESFDLFLDACAQRGCRDFEVWGGHRVEHTTPKAALDSQSLTIVGWFHFVLSFSIIYLLWFLICFAFVPVWLIMNVRSFRPARSIKTISSWLSNPVQNVQAIALEGLISFPTVSPRDWEFETLSTPGSCIRETSLSQATTCGLPRITRLFISTPTVFLPRSQWLFQVFYTTSTLTTLTFHQIHFDEQHWRASFSWMTNTLHANLEDLTISECHDLPNDSLVGFIEHLRTLKRLMLRGNRLPQFRTAAVGPMTEEEKRIDLPNLEEVLAPFDFVLMLTPRSELAVNLDEK
ncbi:hypothetical protein BDN72DRAFT_899402 [Pluteus cervinus]|uniref:Uncharacterized protein n=1 Tax=Pluteus cervinus TaxID=181527 RepID=A0ACD3APS6_9AGAR|nr:hypothetical protein BDN72DRAFT_899402 [Pluteus cervinus]